MPTDPNASLNTLFLAAPDYQPNLHGNSHREGYEPVGDDDGEGEGEARVTQEGVCGNNYMLKIIDIIQYISCTVASWINL